ncbi:hypothetical protein MBM_01590 [Drepanopeziza brunnea f. sp. 'multigermtubi' MB_m1]|uniref:Uncharacterized protein n=1 Tax=Marssonina brunnea f. sp. multigermtubi (strain MB_m1) TaxID=1072389 RepID=K1XFU2_MARBU|nr:uncharacterized protein MBM_01590 [Drepanopeziza brunnea f. sp. 'multigermtubi' MB_m1]EKD19638.1 hypothetical protein MBM_01590 [Drepanopeziza brunnea f. sp. 'multigermtubi' MB_m1]
MDASSPLFDLRELGPPSHYEEPVEPPDGALLMEMIYQYFNEQPPKSPTLHPTPVESEFSSIKKWAASLEDFEASPADLEFPDLDELDGSWPDSIPSPLGSSSSEYSNSTVSGRPETPPLTMAVHVSPLRVQQDALGLELSKRTLSSVPANLNLNRSNRKSSVFTPQLGVSSMHAHAQASQSVPPAVLSELESCTPEERQAAHVGSLMRAKDAPKETSSRYSTPVTRPNTEYVRRARSQTSPTADRFSKALPPPPAMIHRRLESISRKRASRQSIHGQLPSQEQSEAEMERALLRIKRQWEIEQGVTSPPLKKEPNLISGFNPRPESRHVCFQVQEESEAERAPEPVKRAPVAAVVAHPEVPSPVPRKSEIQTPNVVAQLEKQARRTSQVRRQSKFKILSPLKKKLDVAQPVSSVLESTPSQGLRLTQGFFSGPLGMHIKMTRRVKAFSKVEWIVEGENGATLLKCFGQSKSTSRQTEFRDADDGQICQFRKKSGNTMVAQTPDGIMLFTIKSGSIYSSPNFTINHGSDLSAGQWIAKGGDDMESLRATWRGFQVGRISLESKLKKHTYVLEVAPDVDYCIMAALTIVFDDLRMDRGC